MTRGKIDLGSHKLAGLYRAPARSSKHRRKQMPKMPGGTRGAYWMLWRIVEGSVRDTFERHPDYLTDKGRGAAQLSITKRVVGALHGYAAQTAQCRSVQMADAPTDAAADARKQSYGMLARAMALVDAIVGTLQTRPWRRLTTPPPEIHGTPDA